MSDFAKSPLSLRSFLLSLILVSVSIGAQASLIPAVPSATAGTGLGTAETILTISGTGAESGCVAYDGAGDVVGPAACPPQVAGGDEQSPTQTRSLAELGLTSAFNLRLVFGFDEPLSGPEVDDITIDELELAIYDTDGTVCFSSGSFTPTPFPDLWSGSATSGFVFRLDTNQAVEAQSCFDNTARRIGLAASLSNAGEGAESFYVVDAAAVAPAEADLELFKTDSPDPVAVGGTLTYTLQTTNLGPNPATGVIVTDTVPASLTSIAASSSDATCGVTGRLVTCTIATLAPGATATVTVTGTTTTDGRLTNMAMVSADQLDPDPWNNSATEVTTVGVGGGGNADLSILKIDFPGPIAGGNYQYDLSVSNGGPGTATGVTLTDLLPASVEYQSASFRGVSGTCSDEGRVIICELGDIPSGQSGRVSLSVRLGEPGTITNYAQVSAEQSDLNRVDNSDSEQTVVTAEYIPAIDLSLVKSDSQDPVNSGDTFSYDLQVTNRGPLDATGVTIYDALPLSATFVSASAECTHTNGLVTCDMGTVPTGATESVTITVENPNTPHLVLQNYAFASADQTDAFIYDNLFVEDTEVIGIPFGTQEESNLSILKRDSIDPVEVGENFTYSLNVTNHGPNEANDLRLIDFLPPQVRFVTTSRNDICSESAGVVTCAFPSLFPGLTAFVDVTVQAVTDGTGVNGVMVVPGGEMDEIPLDNFTGEATTIGFAVPEADLSITKTSSGDPVGIGLSMGYELTVVNAGPDPASGVEVVDILPADFAYVSSSATRGTCTEAAGTVICAIGDLFPGETARISILGTAQSVGTIVNEAAVSANELDPAVANNTATESTTVEPVADLSLEKSATPETIPAGGLLTYTLIATNDGPNPATSVTIVDPLPDGAIFRSVRSGNFMCSESGGVVTCEMASLAVGGSASVEIDVRPLSTGELTNSAQVSAAEEDPTSGSNVGTATVEVTEALPASIPTASEWALFLLAGLLAASGYFLTRN